MSANAPTYNCSYTVFPSEIPEAAGAWCLVSNGYVVKLYKQNFIISMLKTTLDINEWMSAARNSATAQLDYGARVIHGAILTAKPLWMTFEIA